MFLYIQFVLIGNGNVLAILESGSERIHTVRWEANPRESGLGCSEKHASHITLVGITQTESG